MEEALKIIEKFMDENLIPAMIKSQDEKGLRASGKSAASLRVNTLNDKTIQIVDGSGSFQFQDKPGRGPTRQAGQRPLHEIIYEWLQYKKYGISYDSDKERKSLSYAIATSIHKKGNYIHRTSEQTNVITETITGDKLSPLTEEIGTFYARKVANGYLEAFKK